MCGMYSSRRYSVSRHINNVHAGKGSAIPFVEFVVGRRTGHYLPQPKPDLGSMIQNEVRRIYFKRLIEGFLPPPGDPWYAQQLNLLRPILTKKAINEVMESMSQDISKVLGDP